MRPTFLGSSSHGTSPKLHNLKCHKLPHHTRNRGPLWVSYKFDAYARIPFWSTSHPPHSHRISENRPGPLIKAPVNMFDFFCWEIANMPYRLCRRYEGYSLVCSCFLSADLAGVRGIPHSYRSCGFLSDLRKSALKTCESITLNNVPKSSNSFVHNLQKQETNSRSTSSAICV